MLDISDNIAACQNQAVLAYYKTPEETSDPAAAETADSKTAEAKTLLAIGKSEAASGLLNDAEQAAHKTGDERRELDISIAAAKVRLHRGRKRLRELLDAAEQREGRSA